MIVKHPLWNQSYEQQPDGLVLVTDLDTGQTGYFDRRGRSVRGTLRRTDPQLLDWIGGRPLDAASSPAPDEGLDTATPTIPSTLQD